MIYWIWLQTALGVGSNKLLPIVSAFSTAEKLYKAGESARSTCGIFNQRELKALNSTTLDTAEAILNRCKKDNIDIITYESKCYPECLKNIPDPPFVLYVKGSFPNFDFNPAICIVGQRMVTNHGEKCAYSLAGRLSTGGFIIVSGGALGTDTAAHYGALLNGGKTVLVMPNGFGNDYLASNKKLREKVAENGCIITEFPPDTEVNKGSFKVRNRLLSAFCVATIVVEAKEKSGALITAAKAIEQNRDVFVVPGSPDSIEHKGTNKLLKDCAKPITEISDIFIEYKTRFGNKISIEKANEKALTPFSVYKAEVNLPKVGQKTKKKVTNKVEITKNEKIIKKILPENLSKNAKIIYNQLDKQIFTCDDLLNPTLNAKTIISALGELELYGFIRSLPGGRYTLK